jgi:uncharacterized protein YerC
VHPYLAGFVASDGHVAKYRWSIAQSHKSSDILRKILIFFPEGVLKPTRGSENRYSGELSYTLVYKKDKDSNPFEKWGIPEGNKTYTLRFPQEKSEKDIFLYLRAFFEGDGSIYVDKIYPRVQICSNRQWCEGCMKFLDSVEIRSYIQNDKRHPGISNLIIRRVNAVHDFFNKIYEDPIPLFMDRKYYKWLEIQNKYPKIKERKLKYNPTQKEKDYIIESLIKGDRPFEISKRLCINYNIVANLGRNKTDGRKEINNKKVIEIKRRLLLGELGVQIKSSGFYGALISRALKELDGTIKHRRGIPVKNELKETVNRMLLNNIPIKEVSKKTGIAFSTVCDMDRKLTGGRNNRVLLKIQKAQELFRQGYSANRIRREYGYSSVVIYKARKDLL